MSESRRGGKKGRKYGRQKRNACDAGQRARTTANKLRRIAKDAAKRRSSLTPKRTDGQREP